VTRPHYITPPIEEALPLFRRTDPVTSKAAAASVKMFQGEHHAAILEALRAAPGGASAIAERCGLVAHQVGKRLYELAKAGLIVETGRLVESASGRREREWRAA
jgi:predicted Rossmann fold nucleotide-binding protein DprA/Smf involved in DNA uptake